MRLDIYPLFHQNKEINKRKNTMVVAADIKHEIGQTVGVHVTDLSFGLNARYGWGNGNILEAYKAKNEALRNKIEEWGFRKVHAVEAYYDDEGRLTVKHGNRRTFAAKWIHQDNPDEHIAWDLEPGQIWVTIVEKPNSIIELLEEQVADNEQLAATKLDQLMVYQARVDEIVKAGEAKTPSNAIKLIAKQDYKIKAEKIIAVGEAKDLDAAYKVLKKELAAYETQLKKELKVMTLSPEVLSWLQESYLDACEIKLSFGKVDQLLTAYADKADLLLKEALKEVTLEPREEYAQNGYLSSRWLDNLARKLGLLEEKEKPQKPQKTTGGASFYTPDDTAKSKSTDNVEDEESDNDDNKDDSESPAQPVTRTKTATSSIQTTASKKRDYYFKEVLKTIDGDLGLVLANDQNIILQEPTPGSYTATIELPSKEIAQAFQSLINNLKAAFGDQDAAASLEESKTEDEEEQTPKKPSPLDDVDLGDVEY